MDVLKKIRIELLLLVIFTSSIPITFEFDFVIFDFFQKYNNTSYGIYLKDFFIGITRIGDSYWYFLISFILIVFFLINKKLRILNIDKSDFILNTSIKNKLGIILLHLFI